MTKGALVINGMPNHTKSLIFLSKTAINTIGMTTPITKYFNKTKKDPFKVPRLFSLHQLQLQGFEQDSSLQWL
jgi:hypothetical protein